MKARAKTFSTARAAGGFTLPELLLATSISAIVFGCAFGGFITAQKSLKASEDYSNAKADQIRISDFIAMDLRRCLSVETATVEANVDGVILKLGLPDFYASPGVPRIPSLTAKGAVNYGDPLAIKVTYYKYRNSIYRSATGEPTRELARDVGDFSVRTSDFKRVVTTEISFLSQFRLRGSNNDTRLATTVFNTTLLRNVRKAFSTP